MEQRERSNTEHRKQGSLAMNLVNSQPVTINFIGSFILFCGVVHQNARAHIWCAGTRVRVACSPPGGVAEVLWPLYSDSRTLDVVYACPIAPLPISRCCAACLAYFQVREEFNRDIQEVYDLRCVI